MSTMTSVTDSKCKRFTSESSASEAGSPMRRSANLCMSSSEGALCGVPTANAKAENVVMPASWKTLCNVSWSSLHRFSNEAVESTRAMVHWRAIICCMPIGKNRRFKSIAFLMCDKVLVSTLSTLYFWRQHRWHAINARRCLSVDISIRCFECLTRWPSCFSQNDTWSLTPLKHRLFQRSRPGQKVPQN